MLKSYGVTASSNAAAVSMALRVPGVRVHVNAAGQNAPSIAARLYRINAGGDYSVLIEVLSNDHFETETISNITLSEYWCDGDQLAVRAYNCTQNSTWCVQGACLRR